MRNEPPIAVYFERWQGECPWFLAQRDNKTYAVRCVIHSERYEWRASVIRRASRRSGATKVDLPRGPMVDKLASAVLLSRAWHQHVDPKINAPR